MKKVLLLLLTILLTIGCNQKQKEQVVSQESNPQLTAVEIRNQEIQDSLKEAEKDSLALIAWGDVKFGMSMKEVLATEIFKGGKKDGNYISMNIDKIIKYEKIFGLNDFDLWAKFEDNELCRIYTISSYRKFNDIDKLYNDCNIYIRQFTEKYGNPIYKKDEITPSDFDSEEFLYAKYQIKDKTIAIVLGKLGQIGFYYKILIDNSRFPKKKHVITEKEIKEVRKQMEDTEKIRNNSF
ncbi:hypothetical protein [uncultured Bacteroides sp.]|uniref:hypothetical protein n=1 Tax=uncultured Bacteroides sp. TaxID=162156 RepID=UPI00260E94BD|nr:hypothetical protein [uncultured Bacteroides sp.]